MTEQFQANFSKDFKDVIRWKNTSGYTVPPHGVVQAESFDEDGVFYNVIRPTDVGDLFFLNGPTAVPDGKYGSSLPWDGHPQLAQFEESDVEFATGADIIPDSFLLGEGDRYTLVSNIVDANGANIGSVLNTGVGGQERKRGLMQERLICATQTLNAIPPYAQCAVLYVTPAGTLDFERTAGGALVIIDVANFMEGLWIEEGMYVKIEKIQGIWEPYVADCPQPCSI